MAFGVDEADAAAAAAAITRELTYWYGNREKPISLEDMVPKVEKKREKGFLCDPTTPISYVIFRSFVCDVFRDQDIYTWHM